jgi:hypothetical protein
MHGGFDGASSDFRLPAGMMHPFGASGLDASSMTATQA